MGKKDKGDKGPGVGDLCAAAVAGNIGEIRKIINSGVKVDKGDYDKRTALHLACAEGKLPVVRRMVDELKAKMTCVDSWGGTPLDDALRQGHTAISDFLLSKGAPVGKNAFGQDDAGVLCTAGAHGNVGAIKGLSRRGVDVNLGDYDKRTGIHLAASEGQLEAVKTLVSLKADVNPADRFGGTPLDDASRRNHKEVIKYLKSVGGSVGAGGAVSTQDAADLCDAASGGNLDKLREIVGKGVSANSGDYDLRTAIHLAAAEGLQEVLACLFDELEGNPNVVDRWGGTPLDDARRAGHAEVVQYLESKGAKRGKVSLPTSDADILIDAVLRDELTALKGLKQLESDMNSANPDKRTVLHIAAAEGKIEAVRMLVEELGADVNAKDRWSRTAYDDALQFEHSEVAEFLREKGGQPGRRAKSSDDKPKTGKKKKKKVSGEKTGDKAGEKVDRADAAEKDDADDGADKSTAASTSTDSLSQKQSVETWGIQCCVRDEGRMGTFLHKDIIAGTPATLQLRMQKSLDPDMRLKVEFSGPVVLMGILDKQPPTTRCIELQFDVRLPGEYKLNVTDDDTGAVLLQDTVTVYPSDKDQDSRAVN
eukprot:TRINITY_DN62583_c0_g1_i1.p1 TRINITY_DN62583_c0_g1~~TRINITY_DN62583_c0_g1_i1.p1  ORF type:complete len:594 (+),score=146.46 TRINITY_DN62583_c0_g1_i1:120-1901(+)